MIEQNSFLKKGSELVIVALLCYATGCLTMLNALPPTYISTICPPAGIGLAAVLLWGYRVLPILFFVNVLLYLKLFELSTLFDSQRHVLLLLSLSIIGVFKAWLGTLLINRFVTLPYKLISCRQILLFFVLAGPAAVFVPAVMSVFVLHWVKLITLPEVYYFFLKNWLADCTGIVIFVPLFFIFFDKEQSIWRERSVTLGLPLTLCFLASLGLSWFFQHRDIERVQQLMGQYTRIIKDDLQHNLAQYANNLHIYNDITQINHEINQNDFQLLSQALFKQYPDAEYLEWLQPSADSTQFNFITAYQSAREGYHSDIFRSLSEIVNKLNVVTHSVALIQANELLIYFPVLELGEIKGVIAGIFNIQQVIDRLNIQKENYHVSVQLFNGLDDSHQRPSIQTDNNPALLDPLKLATIDTLKLGDEVWLLKAFPSDSFLRRYFPFSIWQLFIGSVFFPGTLSIVLLALSGRNEWVKIQVAQKTDKLEKSNRKLLSRDKQFQKLVQTQLVIVWRADKGSFRFVYVNNEAEIILGYPIKQWLEEADFWWKRLHPDDKDRVQDFFVQGKSPRNHDLEYRMLRDNGEIVWLRDIFTKVVKDGVVSELYGLMIDITKQKMAEEEFRVAAITFESQQGIMITDKDSNIIRVNKAFTEITGFSSQEVIGKNPTLFHSGRHEPCFYENVQQQLAAVGKFEGEVWNRRKSGEIYPEWQTITAVENNGEVTHYVSVFSDITQKKEAEDKIHSLAFYDALTGLPNRRLLLDRFEQEIAIARRHKQFGAVIFLDLDHFKLLNDSQGHLVGDELLIQVANRLASVLREEDTPARLGGDEFVILLHANAENLVAVREHALTVAEKVRKQLNTPFLLNQYQHQISTSIGITVFPEDDEKPDMILQQADTAMYRSKSSGRNAISFFQPSMQEAADQRLKLEQDLRSAIDKQGFVLFFQPQVDRNGTVFGAEVLIRWEHPEHGIVSPTDFISVAEESSLILDIGLWVLNQSCQQIKAWQDVGLTVPRLSVNVSSRQFRQQDFITQIENALITSQILPQLLTIELTESVMIVDMDDTVAKMKALKNLGVSIAVDDFGTGYSSLAYLKRLPLDVLKIDRSFVRDILTDPNDAVIIETIISMARHLKLKVIAEGVESEEQFDVLKQQGCLMFQGYHFSRPLSAARFAEKYLG